MSGKGNCYDNATVETFFKTIKAELIWRDTSETRMISHEQRLSFAATFQIRKKPSSEA